MKGYYENYSYVLIMEDGRKLRFVNDSEAKEYLEERNEDYGKAENNRMLAR